MKDFQLQDIQQLKQGHARLFCRISRHAQNIARIVSFLCVYVRVCVENCVIKGSGSADLSSDIDLACVGWECINIPHNPRPQPPPLPRPQKSLLLFSMYFSPTGNLVVRGFNYLMETLWPSNTVNRNDNTAATIFDINVYGVINTYLHWTAKQKGSQ